MEDNKIIDTIIDKVIESIEVKGTVTEHNYDPQLEIPELDKLRENIREILKVKKG